MCMMLKAKKVYNVHNVCNVLNVNKPGCSQRTKNRRFTPYRLSFTDSVSLPNRQPASPGKKPLMCLILGKLIEKRVGVCALSPYLSGIKVLAWLAR